MDSLNPINLIAVIHQWLISTVKVDRMLAESDKNNDGYISYAEYVNARRGAKLS